MAERPDIGALRAGYTDNRSRQIAGEQMDFIEMNRPGLSLHRLSLSGKLVQLPPINLQSGVHRRNLHLCALKGFEAILQILLIAGHRMLGQYLSADILRVGVLSKQKHCLICLRLIGQKLHEASGLSHTDRKDAFSVRIQRTRMTDLPLMQDASELRDNIEGGIALLLVYVNDSVFHYSPC